MGVPTAPPQLHDVKRSPKANHKGLRLPIKHRPSSTEQNRRERQKDAPTGGNNFVAVSRGARRKQQREEKGQPTDSGEALWVGVVSLRKEMRNLKYTPDANSFMLLCASQR